MTRPLTPTEQKYIELATRYNVLTSLKQKTGSLYRELQAQWKLVDQEFAARVDRILNEPTHPS